MRRDASRSIRLIATRSESRRLAASFASGSRSSSFYNMINPKAPPGATGTGSFGSGGGGTLHHTQLRAGLEHHRNPIVDRIDMLEREILMLRNNPVFATAAAAAAATVPSDGSGNSSSADSDDNGATGGVATSATTDATASAAADELAELHEDCTAPLSPEAFDDLHQFSAKQPELPIPIRRLLLQTNERELMLGANMVKREYQVRLAHTTRGLMMSPFGLAMMPSMVELRKWYELSFSDIYNCPPITSRDDLFKFGRLIRRIYRRHWNVSDLLSNAILEFSQRENWTRQSLDDPRLFHHFEDLQTFFDMFCGTRTALRLLVCHHMVAAERILQIDPASLHPRARASYFGLNPDDFVGALCHKTSVPTIVKKAVRDALREFYDEGEKDQEVTIEVVGDPDFRFLSVPVIVFDIVTAIIGEAVRANYVHRERTARPPTPIRVLISQRSGQDDCVVRVEDTAGGMPHSVTRTSMGYLAACRSYFDDRELCGTSSTIKEGRGWRHSPIRIPYAAVAASTIGGQVSVSSIDGFGTDRVFCIPVKGFVDRSI